MSWVLPELQVAITCVCVEAIEPVWVCSLWDREERVAAQLTSDPGMPGLLDPPGRAVPLLYLTRVLVTQSRNILPKCYWKAVLWICRGWSAQDLGWKIDPFQIQRRGVKQAWEKENHHMLLTTVAWVGWDLYSFFILLIFFKNIFYYLFSHGSKFKRS